MTVTGVVEGQLNAAKASLNALTDNKNQKMRMVKLTHTTVKNIAHKLI